MVSTRSLLFALGASLLWASACGKDQDGGGGDTASAGGGSGDGDGDSGGSDGQGGDPVTGELLLETRYPEVDDENGNALLPITLTFNSEVDATTAQEAIVVQSSGANLDVDITVSGSTIWISPVEPLALPARVSVAVSTKLEGEDGSAFSGDAWSFRYPLWQTPEGDAPSTEAAHAHAISEEGDLLVATVEEDFPVAWIHDGSTWTRLADLPSGGGNNVEIIGAFFTGTGPVVGWKERSAGEDFVFVAHLMSDEFIPSGSGPVLSGATVTAELIPSGAGEPLIVAHTEAGEVITHVFSGDEWVPFDATLSVAGGEVKRFSSAAAGDRLVVAALDAESDIIVYESSGDGWSPLGTRVNRERTGDSLHLEVGVTEDATYLAYIDGDVVSTHLQVAAFDGDWSALGASLDLEMNNQVLAGTLSVDESGAPSVAWIEDVDGQLELLAARYEAPAWRVLGESLAGNVSSSFGGLHASSDALGNLNVSLETPDGVLVRRFNGSPTLPYGLSENGERGSCAIPADDDPDFPQTLSETGCYDNLATNTLVSAAIPYNINSVLWSDRAYKKRYLLLPEGETIEFSEQAAWEVPVGTIVIKEFYLESTLGDPGSRIPVETRFLIKRCEEGDSSCDTTSWQGYSYQWNSLGSNASLLDGELPVTKDWPITDGGSTVQHAHSYPSRAQCLECHNAAGRLLGVSGAQLNRPQAYGGIIDNQLRAFLEAGLFGDTAPSSGEPESWDRLPSPPDVGQSLENRTRAYFQSNCSHCHRPGGINNAIDFRYYGPGLVEAGNICDKLGTLPTDDASTAPLYQRDSARDFAEDIPIQMPPIATLIPDEQQLPVTKAWIESLTTCE